MQDIAEKIRKSWRFSSLLKFVVFALWLAIVLALAWGTIPLLSPSERLFEIVKMLFYRDYIF